MSVRLLESGQLEGTVLDAVTAALSTVRDPELDESIVDLGFVTEVALADASTDASTDGSTEAEGWRAMVRLRLPTYFCSPNFAYLMVADSYDAVSAVVGVTRTSVVLEDHFASTEINAGVAAGAGFVNSFPAEATAELDELRSTFRRKAHTACLERACQKLLAAGWTVPGLAAARLTDLPAGRERSSLARRRNDIGLPVRADALIFVDDAGRPVPVEEVPRTLRFARTVRVSIDGNAHFCRGLLATRYPGSAADQRPERSAGSEARA